MVTVFRRDVSGTMHELWTLRKGEIFQIVGVNCSSSDEGDSSHGSRVKLCFRDRAEVVTLEEYESRRPEYKKSPLLVENDSGWVFARGIHVPMPILQRRILVDLCAGHGAREFSCLIENCYFDREPVDDNALGKACRRLGNTLSGYLGKGEVSIYTKSGIAYMDKPVDFVAAFFIK